MTRRTLRAAGVASLLCYSALTALTLAAPVAAQKKAVPTKPAVKAGDPLSGRTFRSVETRERGRGGAQGYWTLSFARGRFRWSYSDIVSGGTYAVSKGTQVAGKEGDRRLTGRYDPKTGILVWDGVRYQRATEPTPINPNATIK